MVSVVVATLGTGISAGAVVAAVSNTVVSDKAGLYTAIATVVGSAIGGMVAIYTAKRQGGNESHVRYIDPPSSNELPRALSDLLEDALEDARKARDETTRAVMRAELWESRARRKGWREGEE